MKLHQPAISLVLFLSVGMPLFGQAPYLQLTLRYNLALTRYEVYALPSATQTIYNWGPAQISIVTPASVPNSAFTVTSTAGGAWLDNSQIYAPTVDPIHDFHGVGSLGAPTPLVQGVEKLIFHFTIQGGICASGLRLFVNATDPDSGAPGMQGGDFANTVFAIVPGMPNGYEAYTGNYNNTGTSCSALPLELRNFQAVYKADAIGLTWQTANESGFDHFELERSTDESTFRTLGRIERLGGMEVRDYSYLDKDADPDVTYYYRLKMVDYDGLSNYSPLIHARIGKKGYEILSVSPNPSSDKTTVKFISPEENSMTMTLCDLTGRLLETRTLTSLKGATEIIIDLKDYSAGIYCVTLAGPSGRMSTRIVRAE